MSALPTDTYEHLVQALRAKFPNLGRMVHIRFRDEDGDMLSMQDESDFDAAVDVARWVHSQLISSVDRTGRKLI